MTTKTFGKMAWEQVVQGGLAGLGTVAQGAFGLIGQERAIEANRQAQERQFALNQEAARNAYLSNIAFYNNYNSPEAMVRQLKKAGLSVGMMYGQQGGNGQGHAAPSQAAGNTGITTAPAAGGIDNPFSIAEMAQARKLNAEAEVIEHYGGEDAQAGIALKNAQAAVQNSQEKLNQSLANQADKQAEWQGWQTKIAQIDEEIKAATKESVIELSKNKAAAIAASTEWYHQQIKESKDRQEEIKELARYWHAQVFETFGRALNLQLQNQVTENTIEEITEMATVALRKATAEADNEEQVMERFEKEMEVRLKEKNALIISSVINGLGSIAGGFVSGGFKLATVRALTTGKEIATFRQTKTFTQGGAKYTQTTTRPFGYGYSTW